MCTHACAHEQSEVRCVGGRNVKSSAALRMCTVQHERTCAFSHNGDFSVLISANSAASPAAAGSVYVHGVLARHLR